jgi:hypothetical protein
MMKKQLHVFVETEMTDLERAAAAAAAVMDKAPENRGDYRTGFINAIDLAYGAIMALPQGSDEKRAAYAKANPLGGPARMFDAIAERIRAGEDYYEVLADYDLQAKPADDGSAIVPREPTEAMIDAAFAAEGKS